MVIIMNIDINWCHDDLRSPLYGLFTVFISQPGLSAHPSNKSSPPPSKKGKLLKTVQEETPRSHGLSSSRRLSLQGAGR